MSLFFGFLSPVSRSSFVAVVATLCLTGCDDPEACVGCFRPDTVAEDTVVADASEDSAADVVDDLQPDSTTDPLDTADAPTPDADEDTNNAEDTSVAADAAEDVHTGPGEVADNCRLTLDERNGLSVGFPQSAGRLRTHGVVKAAVLFTHFSDVTSNMSPEEMFAVLNPGATEFYAAVSYGAMQLELEPHLTTLQLSGTASDYAEAIRSFQGHADFIAEAVRLADADYDFSETDLVVVLSPPNATAVAYGPTWVPGPGQGLVVDGNEITNGITSGADLLGWGHLWLNHEMGHSMGLPDLYSYTEPTGFTRPFSVMDMISDAAPELLAWERWQLGWLADDKLICNPDDGTYTLTPIEAPADTAALMVRTATNKVVVVESRRALGYDTALTRVGAVVYTVDASRGGGNAPIVVANEQQALLAGETVTVEGVTVTVQSATDSSDVVQIQR